MGINEQWRAHVIVPGERVEPAIMRSKLDALNWVRAHLAEAVRWGEGLDPELPDEIVRAAFLMGTRMLSDHVSVETTNVSITIEKVAS